MDLLGAVLYPLVLSLMLPLLLSSLVWERTSHLRELQRAMGLTPSTYFTGYFLFGLPCYAGNQYVLCVHGI